MTPSTPDEEVAELRRRLEEAEETLRAIRSGEIDALVVEDGEGERVFTLQGADHAYRELIECMHQGAVSLSSDGTVLYCNRCFAEMIKTPHEKVIGTAVSEFLPPQHRKSFAQLLMQEHSQSEQREFQFQSSDGTLLPVFISLSPLPLSTTIALCMVVTDLTQQKQHQELKDTNRRKDEFLAMLAHELRNPLAPIVNAVAILQHLGIENENLTVASEVIDRQVQHLSHLVDDLLDVSRITLGKVTLHKEAVVLADVIDRAVETSHPVIDARKQHLTITLPSKAVRVQGDPIRLTQIVGNLLINAAKYTDEGGEITLATERQLADVVIRVGDNGMGISAELLPHVFDLFTQGDRSLARSEGGLGIGLTLVRRLVEMHGGIVEARSDGPGRGSEFVVRLPAIADDNLTVREQAKSVSQSNGNSGLNIFVVEDNVDGANILGMLLRIMGHRVRIFHNGPDAIRAVGGLPPQVVLLDIGLPGMSGYEVARELRKNPGLKDSLLIAMTGYGQDEDRQRSSAAGFDHHFVKPVAPEALQKMLESIKATV